MRPNGIVTLTTDFGLVDGYVGIMKGVILGIAPAARLVDTTHTVAPHNIQQAAFLLDTFHRYFPHGTTHLVVVDPGVGSDRRAIALQTPEATFVAPDNGVLTLAWRDALARWGPGGCTVVALTEPRFWLSEVSHTFHGRDIFAPAAAHIAGGAPLLEMGCPIDSPFEAPLEQPGRGRQGELVGRIVHVDNFGNCITNLEPRHLADLGPAESLSFKVIDQRIAGMRRTYSEGAPGALLALIGSSQRLEIAVSNGSAAQTLGVGIGDTVKVFSLASAP